MIIFKVMEPTSRTESLALSDGRDHHRYWASLTFGPSREPVTDVKKKVPHVSRKKKKKWCKRWGQHNVCISAVGITCLKKRTELQ